MSRNQVTVDVPTFCVAFMNGLHKAVPEDLFDRSIVFPSARRLAATSCAMRYPRWFKPRAIRFARHCTHGLPRGAL